MSVTRANPSLRREAFAALAMSLAAGVACSATLVAALGLSPWAVARAIAVPAVLVATAGPSLPLHPDPSLGPANRVTLVRGVVVATLAAFVGEPCVPSLSPALFALASVAFGLDWLDGRVARATGCASPFGARLDMELDAVFVLVLSALDAGAGLGWWVLSAGVARYAFVGAGRLWPWLAAPLPPDAWRPWACGVGISLLMGGLLPVPTWLAVASAGAGAAVIVHSFLRDVAWLWRR